VGEKVALSTDWWPINQIQPVPEHLVLSELLEPAAVDVYRRRIRAGEAIEPLIVTQNGDLLDGHHRWLAFKAEGVSLVRAQVISWG
jgi:ParB-like chromosome segregation protein Spo0J